MSLKYVVLECGKNLSVEMNASLFELTLGDRVLYGKITDLLLEWELKHHVPDAGRAEQEGK
jgi:hypothetical protein